MNVSFGSTFKVPLRYTMPVKCIDTLDPNTKKFIMEADKQVRGKKDISVYSPIENAYYLDILDSKKDKTVKELARKLGVSCYKVPRECMAHKTNNVIVSTGKGSAWTGSEIDALDQVME